MSASANASSRPGGIVILNGVPRAGKSSIASAMQESCEGTWMNLGVDVFSQFVTPPRLRPGMGLRPGGGERPDIEPLIPALYGALYDSVAAHSRHGLNVVVDVGHHDRYAEPLGVLGDCGRRLVGLPVLVVGVRCPISVICARRGLGDRDPVPEAVVRWQEAVHTPGIYDLEVDTSVSSPLECAGAIAGRLDSGGEAGGEAIRAWAEVGLTSP